MLVGHLPFSVEDDGMADHDEYDALVLDRVVNFKPEFPSFLERGQASFLEGLLAKDPSDRLGYTLRANKLTDIREHPFYDGFDFEKLYRLSIPAPWVPPQDIVSTDDFTDGANNGVVIEPTIDPGTRRFDAEAKLRSA